ncbi:cytochrome c5 family protein [Exilibacterium tricleocarpae]|uniref:Cytochrome c5 family protein n=1 Tax=Exilibacterium tricleocarpae TaxID=2591008 RepID=A0A545T0Q5_9GAMM|nr:cytochrome c5 family protein [Exilibacterium tricleocarpae]
MKNIVSLLGAAGLGLVLVAAAYAADRTESLKERIKPSGELCMAGDDCAGAVVAAAPAGPRSGAQVYDTSCTTCHAVGVSGAPKLGAPEDWTARLDKGLDTLYANAINGINAMPAKGLCMDCSDDEIKASVDYMLENSK